MKVLGIETSCDETGLAIYDAECGLLAHTVYSQTDIHEAFGGVVPELASRDHIQKILPLLNDVLVQAKLKIDDINGIAYTAGPGLIGALMVGASFARALGYALNVPTVAVHHMEGHLLAPMLEKEKPEFPFVALLVSGGHTMLVEVDGLGKYKLLGESIDDAAGEAFDKTAKLLGLPYPGGPHLARLAEKGVSGRFDFPRPMIDKPGLDFSFSGLKTSVLYAVKKIKDLTEQTKADVAKGFEEAIVETLTLKCRRALRQTGLKSLVVAGGVSANQSLRQSLNAMTKKENATAFYPKPEFCTDNGAMIAYVGCQRLLAGKGDDDLTIKAVPRWTLENLV